MSDWSSDVCSSDLRQARPRRRQRQLAVAAEREKHDRQAEHQGDEAEDHRQVAGAHAHRRANAVVEGAYKKPAADGGDDQAGEQVAAISTEHGKTSCRSYGSRAFPRAGPAGDSCGKRAELSARRIAPATAR